MSAAARAADSGDVGERFDSTGPRRAAKVLARAARGDALRSSDAGGILAPWSEALGAFPAALLPDLPIPPSLKLCVPGVEGVVRLELGLERASARSLGELVLDASEWRALVRGAEADRVWPADLVALCGRKRSEPGWRIDAEVALAGAQPDPAEQWPAGHVLERLGVQVLSVELESVAGVIRSEHSELCAHAHT